MYDLISAQVTFYIVPFVREHVINTSITIIIALATAGLYLALQLFSYQIHSLRLDLIKVKNKLLMAIKNNHHLMTITSNHHLLLLMRIRRSKYKMKKSKYKMMWCKYSMM
jgi:energy-converting hydrogenase Eha subunit H